jgi:hypothetical protein
MFSMEDMGREQMPRIDPETVFTPEQLDAMLELLDECPGYTRSYPDRAARDLLAFPWVTHEDYASDVVSYWRAIR